jgi:hypothetical protein
LDEHTIIDGNYWKQKNVQKGLRADQGISKQIFPIGNYCGRAGGGGGNCGKVINTIVVAHGQIRDNLCSAQKGLSVNEDIIVLIYDACIRENLMNVQCISNPIILFCLIGQSTYNINLLCKI